MSPHDLRNRVGGSLVLVLIWTSAAVGDGPLFPRAQYFVGIDPTSVAIADLDGDEVSDLAVANISTNNVSVLLNQRERQTGDLNCDGAFNGGDIDPFFECLGGSCP